MIGERLSPPDIGETTQTVACPKCECDVEDVTVYWDGELGQGECPVCETVIEVEPPEQDWEDIANERGLARAERWAEERGSW